MVLYSCLGHAFPRSPPSWSCCPVRTLKAICCVVSTLLCCLKHRRHHIEMQSLCFAKGAIATWTLSCTIRHFQESGNRKPYKNTLNLQLTCSDQPTVNFHRSCVQFRVFIYGAWGETRTLTHFCTGF